MTKLSHSKLTPGFRWNPDLRHGAGGYIAPNGRAVSDVAVRGAIDDYLDNKAAQIRSLALQLQNREISVGQWQKRMEQEIANVHLANLAASKGGWSQLTPADYGRVGQLVKQELGGLKKWSKDGKQKGGGLRALAADIEAGLPLDGRFLNRAQMYAQAGRHTYELVRLRDMKAKGFTHARSIRHARDSCAGCLTQAAAGWQLIDDFVLPGERDCLRDCKCTVEYRKGEETDEADDPASGQLEALAEELRHRSATPEEVEFLRRAVAESGFSGDVKGSEQKWLRSKGETDMSSLNYHFARHAAEFPPGWTKKQLGEAGKHLISKLPSDVFLSELRGKIYVTFVAATPEDWKGEINQPWVVLEHDVSRGRWRTLHQNRRGAQWLRQDKRRRWHQWLGKTNPENSN